MPEDPSLDLRRTGDAVLTADGPPAVADRAGGDHIPTEVSNPAARYRLGEEIARGGMGVVYRATDTVLGREVAVKVLQERYAPDSGTARRFADEARITGQLQHPNIPAVHDLGVLPDGRPFLAMKLIKGETLEDLLKARADPTEGRGRFVAAFEQVCQAVAYAHAHQVAIRVRRSVSARAKQKDSLGLKPLRHAPRVTADHAHGDLGAAVPARGLIV